MPIGVQYIKGHLEFFVILVPLYNETTRSLLIYLYCIPLCCKQLFNMIRNLKKRLFDYAS